LRGKIESLGDGLVPLAIFTNGTRRTYGPLLRLTLWGSDLDCVDFDGAL
jgi:hypothetical protein